MEYDRNSLLTWAVKREVGFVSCLRRLEIKDGDFSSSPRYYICILARGVDLDQTIIHPSALSIQRRTVTRPTHRGRCPNDNEQVAPVKTARYLTQMVWYFTEPNDSRPQ